MTKNTGGPAFPLPHDVALVAGLQIACGMSLRDYMATKAMNGLLAAGHHAPYGKSSMRIVAEGAYELADAMLAARELAA